MAACRPPGTVRRYPAGVSAGPGTAPWPDQRRRHPGGVLRRAARGGRAGLRAPATAFGGHRDAPSWRAATRDRPGAAAPPAPVHRYIRQDRHPGAAHTGAAVAGRRYRMSGPLRQALAGYLSVRRSLGYKLARPEKLLGQFISYLEEQGAATVTTEHATYQTLTGVLAVP